MITPISPPKKWLKISWQCRTKVCPAWTNLSIKLCTWLLATLGKSLHAYWKFMWHLSFCWHLLVSLKINTTNLSPYSNCVNYCHSDAKQSSFLGTKRILFGEWVAMGWRSEDTWVPFFFFTFPWFLWIKLSSPGFCQMSHLLLFWLVMLPESFWTKHHNTNEKGRTMLTSAGTRIAPERPW